MIRGYHKAVDQPGLSATERIEKLLSLKQWLLSDVDFSVFPPLGGSIKDISLVEFEGFLMNIDRRIQLFAAVPGNHYNARSLGSLDSENILGSFQDLHPSGTGILTPKEVPNAISTACEILSTKMDENRYYSVS